MDVGDIADSRIFASKADFCFGFLNETLDDGTSLVELQTLKTRARPIPPLRMEIAFQEGRVSVERTEREFSFSLARIEQREDKERKIQQVGELKERGMTMREISSKLSIGLGTVSNYTQLYEDKSDEESQS